jgi:hypothetical protein
MSRLPVIACLLLISIGCASRKQVAQREQLQTQDSGDAVTAAAASPAVSEPAADADYEPAVASALVFDLPASTYGPPLALDRNGRQPLAFLGFDESVSETFWIGVDDRQRENAKYDRYERRAVSVRSGVRYR